MRFDERNRLLVKYHSKNLRSMITISLTVTAAILVIAWISFQRYSYLIQ